jgi:DNA mismatch endonuclease (patch repair protein)
MAAQRTRNTEPELALRRALHRRGLRYRIHVRPEKNVRRSADVAFVAARVLVMVDGCFWHGCPEHASSPKANAAFWRDKLARNAERDRETDQQFAAAGWQVVRVWEHEASDAAAERVERVVRSATQLRATQMR